MIVWNVAEQAVAVKLSSKDARFHQAALTSVVCHDNGAIALTGSQDHTAKLVHTRSGKILGAFAAHSDSVEDVAFVRSMPMAATASLDHTVCIWDTATLRLRQTCKHDDGVVRVRSHPNGRVLVTASLDGTVRVWDTRTASPIATLRCHDDAILDMDMARHVRGVLALAQNCANPSPPIMHSDGSRIVTGSDDGTARVYDLPSLV